MTTAQAAAGSGRVPVRKTTWLAWSLCAVSLALMAFSILLIVLGRSPSFPSSPTEWTAASSAEQIASVVGALGAPILGALIAAHRPGNRYGWLWCGIGLASAANSVAAAYAVYALLVAPGGLPGGLATAWLASCVTWITQGLWPFAFLLFPDGRLPSPRWRPVGWGLGLAVAWLTLKHGLFSVPGPWSLSRSARKFTYPQLPMRDRGCPVAHAPGVPQGPPRARLLTCAIVAAARAVPHAWGQGPIWARPSAACRSA